MCQVLVALMCDNRLTENTRVALGFELASVLQYWPGILRSPCLRKITGVLSQVAPVLVLRTMEVSAPSSLR